tara:strand:+ start:864 stop:1352 length:489 start_codon:yes stop_codon:yes gene_type:complete
MKYIIFKDNIFFRLASTEDKKNNALQENNSVAKEISDSDFKNVAIGNSVPTLVGDNLVLTTYVFGRGGMTADELAIAGDATQEVTDPSAAQEELQSNIDILINNIKTVLGDNLENSPAEQSLITFLESVDVSQKTSWADDENRMEYIYNLTGCPQVFTFDII